MNTSQWKSLKGVDLAQLHEARMQAHYAVQWLARVARAYIPPRPDDGHTNLGWEDDFEGFTTHPLNDNKRLGLRLADLTLALLNGSKTVQTFALQARTDADARAWLGQQMSVMNLPATALDAVSPYELPAHTLGRGGRYDTSKLAEALQDLASWYANGFRSLDALKQKLRTRSLPAPDIRCWPHHFDLDCLTPIDNSKKPSPTMGAGFCPGDGYYDEPYFYISLYPRPDHSQLPALPPLGHWHTKDFLAALVPANRILAAKDRQGETDAILSSAADGIVKVLSHPVTSP